MGHVRHHAVLVTTFNKATAEIACTQAKELCNDFSADGETGDIVSEIQTSVINAFYSFVVFPDGSNEAWDVSNTGDANRARFIAWLETQKYEDGSSPYDWVVVQYGDDGGDTKIIADSDAWNR